jgi:hypothetical protein
MEIGVFADPMRIRHLEVGQPGADGTALSVLGDTYWTTPGALVVAGERPALDADQGRRSRLPLPVGPAGRHEQSFNWATNGRS